MEGNITVRRRFCGPTDSGNGGYVCGLLAGYVGGVAEVMLRLPPPLEKALQVEKHDGDLVFLKDGDTIVAQAGPAALDLVVPDPPTFAEAEAASGKYSGFHSHPFPCCFVCGPQRSVGDGLRIFPGALEGKNIVASPWIPHELLADETGYVRNEFLWACLDCPGAFAVIGKLPVVLGKLTADVTARVRPGDRCVVIGWKIVSQGRKNIAGTAVFKDTGELVGRAGAVWIELGGSV